MDPTSTIRVKSKTTNELCLLVLIDGRYRRFALPARGEIKIGRAEEADIRVDDESVSREHARIRSVMGSLTTIEDLGTVNGTRLAGQELEQGTPAPLKPYDVLLIGSVEAIVQPTPVRARSRQFWSRTEFEGRVHEMVARAQRDSSSLCLIEVSPKEGMEPAAVKQSVVDVLDDEDVSSELEAGTLELAITSRLASEIIGELETVMDNARIRSASYPSDGTTADGLLATARGYSDDLGERIVIDDVMTKLYSLAKQVAVGDISVLIQGETGAGKQVLAEFLHAESARKDAPFIEINCGAFTETLLESELFGYKKGAFTGASQDKAGLFEAADGGTLFLDEIGDMAPELQVKLLRVLENGKVRRIGANQETTVDVRVLAATHVNIEDAVADGAFREDLYYRLSGIVLDIPPLRERPDELMALFQSFLKRFRDRLARPLPALSPDAEALLKSHSWPGNIRELRNVAERAALLCQGNSLDVSHLPNRRMSGTVAVSRPQAPSTPEPAQPSSSGKQPLTREAIIDALEACAGNQTRAAKYLGIHRRTLTKWLSRYDIPRPRK